MHRLAMLLLMVLAFALNSASPATAQEAAPDTKGVVITKGAAIEAGCLVVARFNAKGNTLEVFDPAQKKFTRTIATFPENVGIDHVSVSPDRKHVAFASQLNNLMTLCVWNVFVIDLETGALNQITPDQATGKGLAKPYAGTGRGTITGKLTWMDQERGGKSSQFSYGNVRLDGLEQLGILKGDGTFVIENVPCNEPFSSYLLYARAMTPRTTKQEARWSQGQLAITLKPGEIKDIGELSVSWPVVDMALGYPSWGKSGLYVTGIGVGYTQHTAYPAVDKSAWNKSLTDWTFLDPCGLMASPDGKYLGGADKWSNNSIEDYRTSRCILFFDTKGQLQKRVDLGSPDTLFISSSNHGAWLPDSSALLVPGTYSDYSNMEAPITMSPCLYQATPGGEAKLAKHWLEAAGKGMITSITPDAKGDVIYMVFSQHTDKGSSNDIWSWNRKTDETVQLTQLGTILSIGSYGR